LIAAGGICGEAVEADGCGIAIIVDPESSTSASGSTIFAVTTTVGVAELIFEAAAIIDVVVVVVVIGVGVSVVGAVVFETTFADVMDNQCAIGFTTVCCCSFSSTDVLNAASSRSGWVATVTGILFHFCNQEEESLHCCISVEGNTQTLPF